MQKDLKPKTPEADELETLSILVEYYEQTHYPIPAPILLMRSNTGFSQPEWVKKNGPKY